MPYEPVSMHPQSIHRSPTLVRVLPFVVIVVIVTFGVAFYPSREIVPSAGTTDARASMQGPELRTGYFRASPPSRRPLRLSGTNQAGPSLVSAPQGNATQEQDAGLEVEDESGEDEGMARFDNRPVQAQWRGSFRAEKHDPAWTSRMRAELLKTGEKVSQGEIEVQQLDCRETVCRMFLTFDDDEQVAAFRAASHDSAVDYEYQDMNPGRQGADKWGITYEVLVKRERPSDLVVDESHARGLDPGESPDSLPSSVSGDEAAF